jgi:hypothetical protein
VNQIRKRLTYANVMSSIAVFLILGGATAFAATKIGSNQLKANSVLTGKIKKGAVTTSKIKNNAITTSKVANGAVTGAKVLDGSLTGSDINAGTLGIVPSADNANKVNGQTATKLFTTLTEGQANVPVGTVAGFSITATCEANNANVKINGPSGPGFVMESGGVPGNVSKETTEDYESAKPGESGSIEVDRLSEIGNATYGVSSVSGATPAGAVFSGVIGYDYDTFNNVPANTCIVYGHLLAG